MSKQTFFKGILMGSLVGSLTALLSAKQSGSETQRKITAYFDEISAASQDVSRSLNRVRSSLNYLKIDGVALLKNTTEEIQKDITDFEFQTKPRVKQINEHLKKMSEDFDLPLE